MAPSWFDSNSTASSSSFTGAIELDYAAVFLSGFAGPIMVCTERILLSPVLHSCTRENAPPMSIVLVACSCLHAVLDSRVYGGLVRRPRPAGQSVTNHCRESRCMRTVQPFHFPLPMRLAHIKPLARAASTRRCHCHAPAEAARTRLAWSDGERCSHRRTTNGAPIHNGSVIPHAASADAMRGIHLPLRALLGDLRICLVALAGDAVPREVARLHPGAQTTSRDPPCRPPHARKHELCDEHRAQPNG